MFVSLGDPCRNQLWQWLEKGCRRPMLGVCAEFGFVAWRSGLWHRRHTTSNVALRTQKPYGLVGTGAQDGHLDFHTAPERYVTSANVHLNLRPHSAVSLTLFTLPQTALKTSVWCIHKMHTLSG